MNSQEIGKKTSNQKLLFRIDNFPSVGGLSKPNIKRSRIMIACDTNGKNSVNCRNVLKSALLSSNSFNETLKSDGVNDEIKRTPSMIPRSKSRKQIKNVTVKFDISPKAEESNKTLASINEKFKRNELEMDSRPTTSPSQIIRSSLLTFNSDKKFEPANKSFDVPSLSLKYFHLGEDNSDIYYPQRSFFSKNFMSSSLRTNDLNKKYDILESSSCNAKEKITEEREAKNQEKTIRNIYDTIRYTPGPLCDSLRRTRSKRVRRRAPKELFLREKNEAIKSNIQEHYEFTLEEISNIWKNTISLIGSVRDHTFEFVNEKNPSVDREQLSLESEMLQLAVDFAINYSKLKTDFLIKWVSENLNVNSMKKSALENFMISKTFAAFYSNDDLEAMARTVEDLNASVEGEDFE